MSDRWMVRYESKVCLTMKSLDVHRLLLLARLALLAVLALNYKSNKPLDGLLFQYGGPDSGNALVFGISN